MGQFVIVRVGVESLGYKHALLSMYISDTFLSTNKEYPYTLRVARIPVSGSSKVHPATFRADFTAKKRPIASIANDNAQR